MATLSQVTLDVTGSPGRDGLLLTVSYVVAFDAFDIASDQPYWGHVAVVADTSDTGGPDAEHVHGQGLGSIHASLMTAGRAAHRSHMIDLPDGVMAGLDRGGQPVALIACVTLTPMAAQTVGPIDSPPVAITVHT